MVDTLCNSTSTKPEDASAVTTQSTPITGSIPVCTSAGLQHPLLQQTNRSSFRLLTWTAGHYTKKEKRKGAWTRLQLAVRINKGDKKRPFPTETSLWFYDNKEISKCSLTQKGGEESSLQVNNSLGHWEKEVACLSQEWGNQLWLINKQLPHLHELNVLRRVTPVIN